MNPVYQTDLLSESRPIQRIFMIAIDNSTQ